MAGIRCGAVGCGGDLDSEQVCLRCKTSYVGFGANPKKPRQLYDGVNRLTKSDRSRLLKQLYEDLDAVLIELWKTEKQKPERENDFVFSIFPQLNKLFSPKEIPNQSKGLLERFTRSGKPPQRD